jgi:hypothetical protein
MELHVQVESVDRDGFRHVYEALSEHVHAARTSRSHREPPPGFTVRSGAVGEGPDRGTACGGSDPLLENPAYSAP